jgi:hypothetical protein
LLPLRIVPDHLEERAGKGGGVRKPATYEMVCPVCCSVHDAVGKKKLEEVERLIGRGIRALKRNWKREQKIKKNETGTS